MKSNHIYCNPNPLKKTNVGDCVVRALSLATALSWDMVFKELCDIAYEVKAMPNSKEVYEEFLKRHGFEYRKLSIKKGDKRPRVSEFARKNWKGIYVLNVANHLVTATGGSYFDTWDSGDKCLYSYWEKN